MECCHWVHWHNFFFLISHRGVLICAPRFAAFFVRHVSLLCDLGATDQVASVSWMSNGNYLAIGSTNGAVELWDVTKYVLRCVTYVVSLQWCSVAVVVWSFIFC